MNKVGTFNSEKLVQIKSVSLRVAVYLHALAHFIHNNIAHAIGVHIETRHLGVGVGSSALVPRSLCLALVGIGPVEDGVLRELLVGQCLEWCAAEVKGMLAFDLVESHICFICIYPLVGFIDDQQVPRELGYFFQFVVTSAEVDRSFQVLQTHELYTVLHPVGLLDVFQILLAREARRILAFKEGRHATNEKVVFLSYKFQIV